jgi:hypothetical protein
MILMPYEDVPHLEEEWEKVRKDVEYCLGMPTILEED